MRRRAPLLALVALVLLVLLWAPVLQPLARGSIIVLDIYSSALWDRNFAGVMTPPPRIVEERIAIVGVTDLRVTWWRPGWGDRHPGILLVNGATSLGNDDPETRRLAEALARAGYLVMLPELPFMVAGRFDPLATSQIDAAFGVLLARPQARAEQCGAFGFSVGGGLLLAAAAREGALSRAAYLGALGAYFDIDTYLASVIGGAQERGGKIVGWGPSVEARFRLPVAAAEALGDPRDRERVTSALATGLIGVAGQPPADLGVEARALWSALGATDYTTALDRLRDLPSPLRERFDDMSPRTHWAAISPPVYWLHDEHDAFEPVAEAERAAATPHRSATRLHLTRLLSHAAAVGEGARREGVDFWVREIAGLLGFSMDVLRRTG